MLLKDLDWQPTNNGGPYVKAMVLGVHFYRTKDWQPNEHDKSHVRGPMLIYDPRRGSHECDLLEAQCLLNHYMEPPRHDQDHA